MDQVTQQGFDRARDAQRRSLEQLNEDIGAALLQVRAANFGSDLEKSIAHSHYAELLLRRCRINELLSSP